VAETSVEVVLEVAEFAFQVEGQESFSMSIDGSQGPEGTPIEIQNSGTYIQWRYVGDVS
jgi:hypothetical protein